MTMYNTDIVELSGFMAANLPSLRVSIYNRDNAVVTHRLHFWAYTTVRVTIN